MWLERFVISVTPQSFARQAKKKAEKNGPAFFYPYLVSTAFGPKVSISAMTGNYLRVHIYSVLKSNLHFSGFNPPSLTRRAIYIRDRNISC